jgi:hypothetical protein
MKRFVFLSLVLILGFSSYANGNTEKVLLFIRHGKSVDLEFMIDQEVDVMTSMLEEAGFKVIVATDSGVPIEYYCYSSQKLELLKPDLKLADVRVSDYVGIIMPCMAYGEFVKPHPEEISLVTEAVALGLPIAAQHGAVHILVKAGALEGKEYAFKFGGVIQDGTIITSSHCPNAARFYEEADRTTELTERFIRTLKE